MIKTEFWADETIGELSRDARLLFIGTWNLADDQGALRWNPRFIRTEIFKYDDATDEQVAGWMGELADRGLVVVGDCGSATVGVIRNFEKHQIINRPSKPRWPIEDINFNGDTPRKKSKRSIGDDWQPSESTAAWAADQFPNVDVAGEAEKFIDHALSNDRKVVDWDRAFKNWIRKADEWGSAKKKPKTLMGHSEEKVEVGKL